MSTYYGFLQGQLRAPGTPKKARDAVRRQIDRYHREADRLEALWIEAVARCHAQGIKAPSDVMIHEYLLALALERMSPEHAKQVLKSAKAKKLGRADTNRLGHAGAEDSLTKPSREVSLGTKRQRHLVLSIFS
jgi:hypothetical protein